MMSLLAAWLGLGSFATKASACSTLPSESITTAEKTDELREQLVVDPRIGNVQRLVRTIVDTHSELLKLPHLRPGKVINQLLGNLVTVCSEIHDRDTVAKVIETTPLDTFRFPYSRD